MKPDRDNATSLYRQIAARLRQEILGGAFEPSGRLPSEAAIGDRFGVSRVTVRLALDILTQDGMIERRQGKGAFIAGRGVRHELDRLESFHESLLAQGLAASMRLISVETRRPSASVAHFLGEGAADCVVLQRLHLVDGEPVAIGRSWLPSCYAAVSRDQCERNPTYSVVKSITGRQIARADLFIGAQAADEGLATLLDVKPGAALIVLDRNSYFADDSGAEVSTFHVRPERYRFVMKSYFPGAEA